MNQASMKCARYLHSLLRLLSMLAGSEPSVPPPSAPYPDPVAVERAAAIITQAESPLIITSDGGEALFDELSGVAEKFAIPVVQFWRTRTAISTKHPLYAGEDPHELLLRSDAVLVLDSLVPWMPVAARPREALP